jgi:hypothetical protein
MAAVTFSLAGFPDSITRFTTNAVADKLQEITIKTGTKRLTIQFVNADGKLAFTGVDTEAIGTAYITIPANEAWELLVDPRTANVFVASASTSVTVEIVAENR